jgi:hypothetical protein
MNVAKINGPIRATGNSESLGRKWRVRTEPKATNISIDWTKRRCCGLCHKGLSCHGLGRLCGRLLRLGNVRATVLAVVDTLPSPCGFCRQRVHNLEKKIELTDFGRATKGIFCLGRNRNTEEVNKTNILVTDNLDLVNETKAT